MDGYYQKATTTNRFKFGGPWDVNGDGVVDIVDIVIVAIAFASQPEDDPETPWDDSENWNPAADLNGDLLVDILDLVLVAIHFGEGTF
jgi:hypothetical protein